MEDLINRQMLMGSLVLSDKTGAFTCEQLRAVIEIVQAQPTIEQPEIIRCVDCCYWIPGLITDNDCFIPPKCGKYQRGKYQQMVGHFADDYCSYAERREVDDGDTD